MKEYLKIANNDGKIIKKHVEQVATLTYRQYGLYKDEEGNLYYQVTDDCDEIVKCSTNDLEHEIESIENMFKDFD